MAFIDSNIIIDALGALIVLIMLLTRGRPSRGFSLETRMLRELMLCCAAVLLIDIPGLCLNGRNFPGARTLLWIFDTLYWVFHITYCYLWILFIDKLIFPGARRSWLNAVYALPLACEIIVILLNPFTNWLFALDSGNGYVTGAAYQLCISPHYLYIAIALFIALRGCFSGERDIKHRGLSLLAYMLLPLCGVFMEFFAYGVSWVWPMNALSLLMLNLDSQRQALADERLSVARAAEKAALMDVEMSNNRTAIMLSQIQPHFLYNALCVIQELCHDKAPEAERAAFAFSHFLRSNMDSLKAVSPIPFSRELNHARNYLALEEMRFGNRLRVEYDLQTENFSLPAMTLEPIVENAVRYGVTKREAGGAVRISTREIPGAVVLEVEDDGAGFDPYMKHEDGRTHIGIENVRQRLAAMCGGSMAIKSERDKGTKVTITLPKATGGDE